jgi:hypothetical protein
MKNQRRTPKVFQISNPENMPNQNNLHSQNCPHHSLHTSLYNMPIWTLFPSFAGIVGSKTEIHCPHSCDRCEDVREVREILLTAEELAREKGRKLALVKAKEHWKSIQSQLKCGLCQATEATWRATHGEGPPEGEADVYGDKWVERHFKEMTLYLCPPCSGGSWFSHRDDTWEILAPNWSEVQHDTEANVWQNQKQKLIDTEVTKMLCKGWVDYRPNTHTLLKSEMTLREEETEIRLTAEELDHDYHEHPFKKVVTCKPSATANQSKEIAMKWKEDKENLEEVNAYCARTDAEIRSTILKRKAREQADRDEDEKNGCGKYYGDNRNRLTARRQKKMNMYCRLKTITRFRTLLLLLLPTVALSTVR